jgi:alkylation response protein AidB-like acyl-CoA dehydrogenase
LREAAALGMATIYVREENGGSGMTRLEAALIFEALSTGCPSVASFLSIHNMVSWVVDRFGSAELQKRYLPRLVTMALISSYCLTEPGAGSDAAALTTRARRDGGDYVLDGVKQFISGAGASDLYLVMARTGEGGPGGISAFMVEKGAPGLSFGANEKKMGWRTQPTRQVIMEGVRVPAANLVGAEGDGFKIAMATLDIFRSTVGAAALGFARRALTESVAHAKSRQLFGAPLGALQLTQAAIATMATDVDASALLVYRAAWMKDSGAARVTRESAMAKWFATEAAGRVCDRAVQLFGARGVVRGEIVERLYRDVRALRIYEGASEIQQVVIARQILES